MKGIRISIIALVACLIAVINISNVNAQQAGTIVFSDSPVNIQNPQPKTDFVAGDNIYSVAYFGETISQIYQETCHKNKKDIILDVHYYDNGKYWAAFYIKVKGTAINNNHLVMDIAPDPEEMTAYSNPDVVYSGESFHVKDGAMTLSNFLSQLDPGKHNISFKIFSCGKEIACGNFNIEGGTFDPYFGIYTRIFNTLRDEKKRPHF